MVIRFIYIVFFLFISTACAEEILIQAQMEQEQAVENIPLKGIITVTHHESVKIDPKSFKMDGHPLSVELTKEVKTQSYDSTILSIYRFELPAKPKGLYTLPEISVDINHKSYSSSSSSYEVKAATRISKEKGQQPTLRLEAHVDIKKPFYPGQKGTFTYRYIYSGNIDLTKEELPLFNQTVFLNIGDKQAKQYHQGELNVTEISQQFQAVKSGEFTFPPSVIEGYAYQIHPIQKKKTYLQPVLHAETTEVVIVVDSFPPNAPNSFQGAVGKFTIHSQLLSPRIVLVGDPMQLAIEIRGTGDFSNVNIPHLDRLRTLFKLGDFPSSGEVQNGKKRFLIEIIPLSDAAKEIPPIDFTYFDPEQGKYVTTQSESVPITVKKVPEKMAEPKPMFEKEQNKPFSVPEYKDEQVSIPEVEIDQSGQWFFIWVIPLAGVLIIIQIYLKRLLEIKKAKREIEDSESLYQQSKASEDTSEWASLISRAFLLRLLELHEINDDKIDFEQLPQHGISGQVREFLLQLQMSLFSEKRDLSVEALKNKGNQLFESLK